MRMLLLALLLPAAGSLHAQTVTFTDLCRLIDLRGDTAALIHYAKGLGFDPGYPSGGEQTLLGKMDSSRQAYTEYLTLYFKNDSVMLLKYQTQYKTIFRSIFDKVAEDTAALRMHVDPIPEVSQEGFILGPYMFTFQLRNPNDPRGWILLGRMPFIRPGSE
ncbi:hypothetical protein [Flaviaesturariibacter amylovorans]